jgi:dynein heavy chain
VSKVFQGISKCDARANTDEATAVKLWAHECMRVFQDRLISQEDRDQLLELLKEKTAQKFKKSLDDLI